jgi:stringent starvation protein B
MANMPSTKPYLVRALHEWCVDNGLTPHLLVEVNANTRVPMAYVNNGEIVLNLNYSATKDLQIGNEAITFSARFAGVSHALYVPMSAVRGIFSRENGQGMAFPPEAQEDAVGEEDHPEDVSAENKPQNKKPTLKLVK